MGISRSASLHNVRKSLYAASARVLSEIGIRARRLLGLQRIRAGYPEPPQRPGPAVPHDTTVVENLGDCAVCAEFFQREPWPRLARKFCWHSRAASRSLSKPGVWRILRSMGSN